MTPKFLTYMKLDQIFEKEITQNGGFLPLFTLVK